MNRTYEPIQYSCLRLYYDGSRKSYYQYLFEDPVFVAALKERWKLVKPRLDKIPGFIDKMTEYNKLAYDHNVSGGKNPRATQNQLP